jgi:phytol kinase
VERAEPVVHTASEDPVPRLFDGQRFERGEIVEVAPGLFLTPYPTDDELIRFILPGPYGAVVSLLDPDDADDVPWIEKERELMATHAIELLVLPIPRDEREPQVALEVARRAASLPRPLVVHAFLSAGSGRSPAASAFLRASRLVEAESLRAPAEAPTAASPGPAPIEPASARGVAPFMPAVPSVRLAILAGPPLVLLTAAAAALAGWLRAVRRVPAPYTRKIFHFVIFTSAGILHIAGGLPLVSLFGGIVSAAVLYAVGRGDGFAFYEAMARPSDAPRRTMFIVLPLVTTAIGGLVSALLFERLAYVGYLVAGWGDAVGEPVGTAFGRTRYRVPSLGGVRATRSLEGSTAVFLVGALAAFLGLSLGGVAPTVALAVALACAVVGATVEAFSTHGLDNLTLQIAASGTAWLLLR